MIQDILPRYQEIADGVKTAFTVPFDTLSSDYIVVYVDEVKQNSGYSLNNKTVNFSTAPSNKSLVTILRILPIEWTNETYGSISPQTISSILTKIVAQIQTLKEECSRAVKTNPYDKEDGRSISESFLSDFREAQDILEQFKKLSEDLTELKEEIDAYIEDASGEIVDYINNMVSDKIGEYNQNAATKTNELNTRAAYLESVADKTEFVYNNRERIAYFKTWPSTRL